MRFLKAATACTIMLGPFVDKTDGVTLKTDATTITDVDHATTGIFLSKNGGTAAVRHQIVTASIADAYGMMNVTLDTTDTGTSGRLDVLFAKAATYLPVNASFMVLPANVYDSLLGTDLLDVNCAQWLGTAILNPGTAGTPDVNAKLIGATAQTGRDIGASVLLSAGIGAGQLDFTSGVVKANLAQILGTALTETAGQIAGAFKKFFDKATPTGTINSLPDAVAGANGGLPTTNGTKVSQTVDLTAGQTIAANVTQVNGAAQTATLDTIKADSAAILADTGTDGVLLTAAYDSAKTALTTGTTIADADALAANSLLLWIRRMRWMLNNKMAVVDANGAYTLYKDDGTTSAATGSVTDDSTTTTRSTPTWA